MTDTTISTSGITLADLAGALCTLRGRAQFPAPIPDFTVQARRIVITTVHGTVWVTPGLVRAADGSWRRTLSGTALDRASRAAKTIAANDPSIPVEVSSPDQVDEEPLVGLVLGGRNDGDLFTLLPSSDDPDLALDVTPVMVRDGLTEVLPERPLCSDGVVALASWLSGVLDGVVLPGDEALIVCESILLSLDSVGTGFTVSVSVFDEPEGLDEIHDFVCVQASHAQVRASAEWWQRRAAGHLGQLI